MMESSAKSPAAVRLENTITGEASRGTRILTNALIGLTYTAGDLVESKAYRAVSGWVFDGKAAKLEEKLHHAVSTRNAHEKDGALASNPQQKEMQKLADEMQIQIIRDSLRKHEAVRGGFEFAEEVISDKALKDVGQWVMDKVTQYESPDEANTAWGREANAEHRHKHSYVKATAENIADYTNAVLQIFFNDKWIGFVDKDGKPKEFMGVMLAEKSANFVNPGNTEAALRILADMPVVGGLVGRIKHTADHWLENSKLAGYANVAFGKWLTGYHVMNTRAKAVEQATAKIVANHE